MLKAAGSILIIGATTLYGIKRAQELKEQYVQMEYLQQLFYRIQSEIRYARSPLGEIFLYVGGNAREPYRTWLLGVGNRMQERNGGTFADLWETSIRGQLSPQSLPGTELQRLIELGGRLGLMDLEMQVKTLDLYLLQLSRSMEEAREGMREKVRLCHCLGVMSGMLIVTLLL